MNIESREYAYPKPLLLSALYDTFDKLGWKLLSANSDAGLLMTSERKTGVHFIIRVYPKQGNQMAVEVSLELDSGASAPDIAARMFATLDALLKESL